jgi:ribosomal protein S18 acetylase RimI-like enzyme
LRLTLRQLKNIIQEALTTSTFGDLTLEEDMDEKRGRYKITVFHPKTFSFPGHPDLTVPDYETSQMEARIADGELEIVSIRVDPSHRRRGIARHMVNLALDAAHSMGLTLTSSGIYSAEGSSLLASLGGMVSPHGVRHKISR